MTPTTNTYFTGTRRIETVKVQKQDNSVSYLMGSAPEEFAAGMYQLMGGVVRSPDEPTFEAYADNWFNLYHAPKIGGRWAYESRIYLKRHLYPFFGQMRLGDIKRDDVQRFFNTLADHSRSTVKHIKNLMNQIMESAVEDGILPQNVMQSKRYVLPSRETERKPISHEEAADILAHLHLLGEEEQRLMALLLFTGIRRGELLALRWEHVDLENNVIRIRQAVTFDKDQNTPLLKPPKSKAGNRDIPITPDLRAYLGKPKEPDRYVIGNDTKPLTRRAYDWCWQQIGKTIDLHGATAHCLRHTFATMAAGTLDLKTLQTIMGHSKADITLNRYMHPEKERLAAAGANLTDLYATKKASVGQD